MSFRFIISKIGYSQQSRLLCYAATPDFSTLKAELFRWQSSENCSMFESLSDRIKSIGRQILGDDVYSVFYDPDRRAICIRMKGDHFTDEPDPGVEDFLKQVEVIAIS